MRQLGDTYVKSEFRMHKSVTNQEQLTAFFNAWRSYLDQIGFSARANESISAGVLKKENVQEKGSTKFLYGKPLPEDIELNEDQLEKLKALKDEANKLGGTK